MTLKNITRALSSLALIFTIIIGIQSCSKTLNSDYFINPASIKNSSGTSRVPETEVRHTFIMFSLGHNNLSSSLKDDIEEIKQGFIPEKSRSDNVFLVFSHHAPENGNWSEPSCPKLERIYRNTTGEIVTETLKIWEEQTISVDTRIFTEVFNFAKNNYPSVSYGALFSSHATGYLPVGFYLYPDRYEFTESETYKLQNRETPLRSTPYIEPTSPEGWPLVKSFGQDVQFNLSYETDIRELAKSIPMQLSYILFDACLMGGIEVAYELKDKCNRVGFSQAEVLAEGFVYKSLGEHLLKGTPHPEKICEDYFNSYNSQSDANRSATISMIDCRKLEPLAQVCGKLFSKYRDRLNNLPFNEIQRFYRFNNHWFYDLESIVSELGANNKEMGEFYNALNNCTIYKAATPEFMLPYSGFHINVFSGLSMYLPSNGHSELNKYYRTLEWNKDTGLVL